MTKPEGRECFVCHIQYRSGNAFYGVEQWSISTTFFTEEEAKAYMQGVKDAS